MSLLINNVRCDAFAHVDKRAVSDTVNFSLSKDTSGVVTAFLFCDDKTFPVSAECFAECCIVGIGGTETVACEIGASGEISVPIVDRFRIEGERLSCEINVSGMDGDGEIFRYKAANFLVAVTG